MWEPQPLATLRASAACTEITSPFMWHQLHITSEVVVVSLHKERIIGKNTSLITVYKTFVNLVLHWTAVFDLLVVFRLKINIICMLFVKHQALLILALAGGE
jgi:hypothetical protein